MKKHKRNKKDKAYIQGFRAGIKGHSLEDCPYSTHFTEARGLWCSGWREGRGQLLSGSYTGIHEK